MMKELQGSNSSFLDVSRKYFLSPELSDAIIECGNEENEIIPVHRFVLINRSDYFARMFANGMQEANTGAIKITEFSQSCVKELLCFIYTGRCSSSSLSTSELLIAADKYGLGDLKKLCERQLVKGIRAENAVEMYELGRNHGSRIILEEAKQVIYCNRDKCMKDADALKEFASKYPELMMDVLKL